MSGDETRRLLEEWHGGNRDALGRLLDRNLGWIRARVELRMGPLLRAKGGPTDYVQDAMVEILRYGPKFVMSDEAQFRVLMVKIVENVLRGRHDWFTADRRAAEREQATPEESALDIDARRRTATRPSQALARSEAIELTRLGIALLDEEDREVIVLRQWDGLSFAEIGGRLGIEGDAVRMRFQRALPRLAQKVELLSRGDIESLIDE
jgi:RNA polymerase sigma factor (sigma-70 family)